MLGAFGLCACGASINALYEGDVRFEHCMSLDDNAAVKPTIRTACWDEWRKFYTYGQTRDRIEYAKLRSRQLRAGSDIEAAALAPTESPTDAVPEPTTAAAPPPMMFVVDAGTGSTPNKTPDDSTAPPRAECSSTCDAAWVKCKKECVTPLCNRQTCISKCERTCAEEHAVCMRGCFL